MLDTNIVNDIVKYRPKALEKFRQNSDKTFCISVITHAEIMYGLAKKPEATQLSSTTGILLNRLEILTFDEQVSATFGSFKRDMELSGKSLQPMDLLIAAHAHCIGAVLVTADKAFEQLPNLIVEDWTL